ncbi:unnamed protein product [Auanema sp. JU1783]|nr:unnamed protein product [Auanema sp. JU1783]
MFRSQTRCAESRTPLSYMTCPDENASIPSFEEIGQGRWLNRPEFHVPCLGMSLIIIILYLLELRVVLSYRKYSPFTSTFFRIWTVQAIADLLSLLCYIIAFVRNMPHTWGFWMKLNATPLPSILGTMNGAVVLSQMIGVCIISLNRYLKICKPTSELTVKFDSVSTFGFSLLILVFPTMTTALILFPGAPRYVYIMGQSYVIAACYQNPKMLQAFSGIASIMCIISLFISTICYGQVMQNIAVLNCVKRRSHFNVLPVESHV